MHIHTFMNELVEFFNITITNTTLINSGSSLVSTMLTNFGIGIVCFVLFLLFKKKVPQVYEPVSSSFDSPKGGILGWLTSCYSITEEEIQSKRGLDVLMYLKVTKYLFFIILSYSFYGCVILIPVHIYASPEQKELDWIGKLGMSNIPKGSSILIADVISVLWNTIVGSAWLYFLFREYCRTRSMYKSNESKVENYAIIVREIPSNMSENEIERIIERVFPNKVWSIRKAFSTKVIDKKISEREKVGKKLESAEEYYVRTNKRKVVCTKLCGCKKRDGILHYKQKFDIINDKLLEMIHTVELKEECGTAFVIFKDRLTAMCASQSIFDYKTYVQPFQASWIIDQAPAPECVIWENLSKSRLNALIRSLVIGIITVLLVVFWMIPIGFASSISNLSMLTRVFPFLTLFFNDNPILKNFVEGFLPGLALIVFVNILARCIVSPMSKLEGHWSYSEIESGVFKKYYLFLVVNIFLGSIFAQNVLFVLPQVLENPMNIIYLLAESLPSQTEYFIEYVMILAFSKLAIELLRPHHLIWRWIVLLVWAKTKREKRNAEGLYYFDMSIDYAFHCLVFIVASSYSTLNPLILPFSAMYFGISYVVGKYNMLYVYTPRWESNGDIFPDVFTRLCWGLIVYQLFVCGVLNTMKFPEASILLIICIFQFVFWKLTIDQFESVSKYGSLFDASETSYDPRDSRDVYVPHKDTYKYISLRDPNTRFQLEDQSRDDGKEEQERLIPKMNEEIEMERFVKVNK